MQHLKILQKFNALFGKLCFANLFRDIHVQYLMGFESQLPLIKVWNVSGKTFNH